MPINHCQIFMVGVIQTFDNHRPKGVVGISQIRLLVTNILYGLTEQWKDNFARIR